MEFVMIAVLMITGGFTVIAHRLSTTIITAPMVFLAIGYAISHSPVIDEQSSESILHIIAEVSLIILLFLDASQIDLSKLRKENLWPTRMLSIGLPLAMLFGTLAGIVFFPDWPLIAIALVAAILAPTDAALGQAVVSNKDVPEQERQSLVVESGLNDGLALPVILFFASLLAITSGATAHDSIESSRETQWLLFGLSQIVLGPLVGVVMGWTSGKILLFAESKKFTSHTYQGIGVLALAGNTYLIANLIGGNGFIAAFVAGLTFGNLVKGHCRFLYEFTESEGQMLVWASFLFIGLGLMPNAIEQLSLPVFGYILVSLIIVRPLAIYVSLMGTDSKPMTRLFFGWFGPRGLATALFALLVVHEIGHEFSEAVLAIAINAVWISALLHGITAYPGSKWYAKKYYQ